VRDFHPTADTLFAQPCLAIHVQPHLTSEAQGVLRSLQKQAAGRWPGALHLAPAHAFHVTIYPLVPTSEGFDKEAYWNRIESQTRALVAETCAGHPPVDLRFSRLKVMPVGIIAVAEEGTGLIERMRRRIVETLPPPPGLAHRHYDLIHTTLARFADAEPVPASAVERVEAVPADLSVRVERIKIFRETVFPCIVGEELASVPLMAEG
jgi:2'-5' RNA ligase